MTRLRPIRLCVILFIVYFPPIADGQSTWLRNNHVEIQNISVNGYHCGELIWLNRELKRVKAKYFASGNVYQKYLQWSKDKNVIVVCSGAYANESAIPDGLTVDNGVVVNRNISSKMDGLVLVQAVGGVVVTNLEECNLQLGIRGDRKFCPLYNSKDKIELLDWAVEESATIFQTHLLAYGNIQQIHGWAPHKEYNRRFLVLGYTANNELRHIIANIKTEYTLYEATSLFLPFFRDQCRLNVVAIINLDVGARDIIRVYDDYGRELSNIRTGNLSEAVNLIAYYFE